MAALSHAKLIEEIAVARNEAREAREACDLARRIIRGSLLKGGSAYLSPKNAAEILAQLDRAADGEADRSTVLEKSNATV